MKKSRFAVLALAAMVLAGCATNTGYVGTWECNNPAPELSDGSVKSITVYIMEQGGFSLTAGDADGAIIHGVNGQWAVNETGGLELIVDGESEKTDRAAAVR